jgi:putative transposase
MRPLSYSHHHFRLPVIHHAAWLYLRFSLSYRDVEELPAERGLDISYETVRRWVTQNRPGLCATASALPHPTHSPVDLNKMVVGIGGKHLPLWRAVDDEHKVLDMLVQRRPDKTAAMRLVRKLVRNLGFAPEVLVTDRLRSYGAAIRSIGLICRHEREQPSRELAPVRRRERKVQRFKSAGSTQRFLSAQAAVYNVFDIQRHLIVSGVLRPRGSRA